MATEEFIIEQRTEEFTIDVNGDLVEFDVVVIDAGSSGPVDNFTVRVSSNDLIPKFLVDKITAGTNVSLTTLNPGGDEELEISTDLSNLSINDLNDVDINTPLNDQHLVYNFSTSNWENQTYTAPVLSVNSKTGVVVLTTTDVAEGTNLYYTEARVNANTNVSANTTHRSSDGTDHSNVVLNDTHRGTTGNPHSAVIDDIDDVTITTAADGNILLYSSGLWINLDGSTVVENVPAVVSNTNHRLGDGSDHSEVALNITHRDSDGKSHSDVVLANTHRADNSIHFTEVSIDHTNIQNIGTNSHLQIDTHISDTSNPHDVLATQITDFDTEVSNNTDVAANTVHRSSDGSDHTFIDQSVTTIASPTFIDVKVDSVKLSTTPPTITDKGTIWWNDKEYTANLETGLGPVLQIGQEQYLLYYNDTGFLIPNGTVLHPKAATVVGDIIVPTPELADNRFFEKSEGTLTVATSDIADGELGFATRFGKVRGVNTSIFSPGQTVWLGEGGLLTETRPQAPRISISMGGSLNSELFPDGELFISITRSITDLFNDSWNGAIKETFDLNIDSNGATVTASLTNQYDDTMDLTLLFSDGSYRFVTNPAATIVLTPGTDTVSQTNYIYIDQSDKLLKVSTSSFPKLTEHCKVAQIEIFSASRTLADGVDGNQNWNDHIKLEGDNGHILHMCQALRKKIPASYESGCEASSVIADAGTNIYLKNTAGIVYQLHEQNFPIIDMTPYSIDAVSTGAKTFTISDDGDLSSTFPEGRIIKVKGSTGNNKIYSIVSTNYSAPNFIITVLETISSGVADGVIGDSITVVNDFTIPNILVDSLTEITTDASGDPLLNTSFKVVEYATVNKTGQVSHIKLNMPLHTYSKNFPSQAETDANGYSIYEIPIQYGSIGFLMREYTFINNAGVYTQYSSKSLLGFVPNSTAGSGGGSSGVTTFTGLNDTPSSYVGQANKITKVNGGETALEFIDEAVTSVNGATGIVVLDTDDISEGSSNLYYTEVRVSANSDVTANTAKVGVTDQISNVVEDTTPQQGGDLEHNQYGLVESDSLTSDENYEGTISGGYTSAEALSKFEVVRVPSGALARADIYNNLNSEIGLSLVDVATATPFSILRKGVIRNDAWSFTAGAPIFIDVSTYGAMTQTVPSTTGNQIRCVGYAKSPTVIYFEPSNSIFGV